MNKKNLLFMVLILMIGVISANTFSVQGVLRDPLGKTVEDGSYSITLKLYDQNIGGTALWTEVQGSVGTSHGVFSIELGSVTSLSDIPFDTDYWLGITVESDPEMSPRLKILKSPYAMSVYGSANEFPSLGNVGVGTHDPQAGLHIVTFEGSDDLLKIVSNDGGSIEITSEGNMGVNVENPTHPLEISGNLRMRNGGALVFDDGSSLASGYFGGTAESILSPGNALITADSDSEGGGEIQFINGSEVVATIDSDGRIQDKSGDVSPVGSVIMFAGSTAPDGWLLCDGTLYSNSEYSDLYAAIGTSYGYSGSSFKVPDMRGKGPMGYNSSNSNFNSLGKTGGAERHTLSSSEMPSHYHSVNPPNTYSAYEGNHTHTVDPSSFTAYTSYDGSHHHTLSVNTYGRPDGYLDVGTPGRYWNNMPGHNNTYTTTSTAADHRHSVSVNVPSTTSSTAGNHRHSVDISSFSSSSTGSSNSHNNLQPYNTFNFIIKY